MDSEQFEARLRELEAMTGQDVSMDLFNEHYESLLNEVRAMAGPKYQRLSRMQRLLFQQFMFLFGAWRRAKGMDENPGSGMEIIQGGIN